MILDIPPHIEQLIIATKPEGMTAHDWALETLQNSMTTEELYFDIDEIDKAIKSGFTPVPRFDSVEELADWLGGAK